MTNEKPPQPGRARSTRARPGAAAGGCPLRARAGVLAGKLDAGLAAPLGTGTARLAAGLAGCRDRSAGPAPRDLHASGGGGEPLGIGGPAGQGVYRLADPELVEQ